MGTSDEGNWGYPINVLTTFFLVLVNVVLFLRIFTRVYIVHAFWWDDFTIILAVLGNTIGAGLDFVEVHWGFGRHQQFLSPHDLQEFKKYTYGEWIQTFATLMWTKVSICLFLLRLPSSRPLKRPLQWAVAFLLFSNTILTTLWIMQCQPIHAAWDLKGTCMSRGALEGIVLTQAIISVVSDFTFATLPILFLWRVQVDFTTKAGLWVLMCLGFITGSFCLVRTVLNNQSLPLDATYNGIVNWVWRLFEVTIGIIAACIPTLRPLYTWTRRSLKGEGRSLSQNIRFPLSNHKQNGWMEKVENARSSPSDEEQGEEKRENSPREQLGIQDILIAERKSPSNDPKDRTRDTMRDDLVSEGIIDPKADNRPMSPVKPTSYRNREQQDRHKDRGTEGMVNPRVLLSREHSSVYSAISSSSQGRAKDKMRDDLIREGIVRADASSDGNRPMQPAYKSDALSL